MEQNTPRFEDGKSLLIAGSRARYQFADVAGIAAQWHAFGPHIGHIPGQVGSNTYGVCCNFDGQGSFDYICGVEVESFSPLPGEWSRIRLAPQRYAIFAHTGHISTIKSTWDGIFQWLPQSGYTASAAPQFELYTEAFDQVTGNGGLEIWIPIRQ
jgi:AraC family transcriptional regulator